MKENELASGSPRNINNSNFDHVAHDITDLSMPRLGSVTADIPQASHLSPEPVSTQNQTHILHHQSIDQEGHPMSTSASPLLETMPLQRENSEQSVENEGVEHSQPRHDHSYHNGVDLTDVDVSTNKDDPVQDDHQHDVHLSQQAVAHMYIPHNITYNMNINDANDHYNCNATNMASLYDYDASLPQAQHQQVANAVTEDQTHPLPGPGILNSSTHDGHVFDTSIQQGLSYHLQDETNIHGHHSIQLGSHQTSHHHHHQMYGSQLNTESPNNQQHLHTGFIQTHDGEQRGPVDIQHQESDRSYLHHLPSEQNANGNIQLTHTGNYQHLQNGHNFHFHHLHTNGRTQPLMAMMTNQHMSTTTSPLSTIAKKGKKVPAEIAWRNKYQELIQFHSDHGHSDVPQLYSKNKSLGKWVGKQREHYKLRLTLQTESLTNLPPLAGTRYSSSSTRKSSCPLTDERVELLKKLDFKFVIGKGKHALHHGTFSSCDALTQVWEQRFKSLKKYKQVYGHTDVPLKSLPDKPLKGQLPMNEKAIKTLARWVATQRRKYQSVKVKHEVSSSQVLEDRFKRLQAIEFDFGVQGGTAKRSKLTSEDGEKGRVNHMHWNERYKELCDFVKEHGHANVPQTYKDNIQLARWVSSQREMWKQLDREKKSCSTNKPRVKVCNTITDERIQLLEKVGFHFSIFHKSFIEKVSQLKLFKETHGHLNVKCSGDTKKLYDWIHRQRNLFRQYMEGGKFSDRTGSNPMTSERVAMLEEIGFDWQYDFEQIHKIVVKNTTLNAAEGKEQKKRKKSKKRKLDVAKTDDNQESQESISGNNNDETTTTVTARVPASQQIEHNSSAEMVNINPALSKTFELDKETLPTRESAWKENQVSDTSQHTNETSDIASTVQPIAFQDTQNTHFPDVSVQGIPRQNHVSHSHESTDGYSTYRIHKTVNHLIQREHVKSVHKKGTKPEIWTCHYDQLVEYKNRFGHCRVPGVSTLQVFSMFNSALFILFTRRLIPFKFRSIRIIPRFVFFIPTDITLLLKTI